MPMTATKEKPILFSAPMVRAILDGRKTQTRRVIKPQPVDLGHDCWEYGESVYGSTEAMEDHLFHNVYGSNGTPYGALYEAGGDRLWVRETWGDRADYSTIGKLRTNRYYYAADGKIAGWKYRRSIFMPRWASRITLEITDVRVQRVQEITEADAKEEGVETHNSKNTCQAGTWIRNSVVIDRFARLWDQINAKRGYGWDVNPWVWAITFKRVNQ